MEVDKTKTSKRMKKQGKQANKQMQPYATNYMQKEKHATNQPTNQHGRTKLLNMC